MRIFITGATGFIGKHLLRRLSQTDHEARCLVRNPAKTAIVRAAGATPVPGSLSDRAALRDGLRGCDWVFNLAGLYAMWHPDRRAFQRTNIEGTRNVMECALEAGVSKVVHISTVAVYGKPAESPFNEDSAPGPAQFSEYGRTKAIGDRFAWRLHHHKGLPLVALYPGIVLGPGDDKASGQYIQDILWRRVPSTIFHHSVETYVHVRDVVEAILRVAERPDTVGKRYFLGKEQLNGRDFARLIGTLGNVRLPPVPFPDPLVLAVARILTCLANLTGRSPWWGLSVDAGRTLKEGFAFDGSRAEQQLNLVYTPVMIALAEAIASYRRLA